MTSSTDYSDSMPNNEPPPAETDDKRAFSLSPPDSTPLSHQRLSENLHKFDVNSFLKKTLSNFDLYQQPQQQECQNLQIFCSIDRDHSRNIDSIDKKDKDSTFITKNDKNSLSLSSTIDRRNLTIGNDQDVTDKENKQISTTISDNDNKRICSTQKSIDDENVGQKDYRVSDIDSYADKKILMTTTMENNTKIFCAYCGTTGTNFEMSTLYCDSCYRLFTIFGRSEIKRRLLRMISDDEEQQKAVDNKNDDDQSDDVNNDDSSFIKNELSFCNKNESSLLKNESSADKDDSSSSAGGIKGGCRTVAVNHQGFIHPVVTTPRHEKRQYPRPQQLQPQQYKRRSRRDMLEQSRNFVQNPGRIYTSPVRYGRAARKPSMPSHRRPTSRSPPTKGDPRHPHKGARTRGTSWSSSSSVRPVCRICQTPGDLGESLITPCRCSGTMQYIHNTCLVHWLEVSTSKKMSPAPQCELCGYRYRTHHCYKLHRFFCPQCTHQDKILHLVFFIMALVMIGCTALSITYLKMEKGRIRSALTAEDIVVIACSLLFFSAFFVAVFTQYRAQTSLCRLLTRCWTINRHWRVKDYDQMYDVERKPGGILQTNNKSSPSSALLPQPEIVA